jgi:predicted CopG family antitoxin
MNTTITISKELKEKLDSIGLKSESYNDIVSRLHDVYMQSQRQTVQLFVRETLAKYGSEMSPIKKKMLQQVANGNSRPWSEVKKEL